MNSELEVLKKIWDNERTSSIRLISKQIGLGIDYTRYICNHLFKKGQIKPIKGERDWYGITPKGRRALRLRQLMGARASSGMRPGEGEVSIKGLKGNLIEVYPPKFSEGKLGRAREEKLNLGKSIAKAVSLLTPLEILRKTK